MSFIKKESAFKIFYYSMAWDGNISSEELQKLEEISWQVFGDDHTQITEELIAECKSKTSEAINDREEAIEILSECIDESLNDTTEESDKGLPSRLLVWDLLLLVYSDGNFNTDERRLLKKINRKLNLGDSVMFEMEQYIRSVWTIDKELNQLKDSMDPYKLVRPIVDELENRRSTIKQAAIALIEDELTTSVEKLTIQDDVVDKARTALKDAADPMMQKVNEQAGKMWGSVKQAATPAASEAGKKIGKAFMGFGSKLMGKKSVEQDEHNNQED